MADYPIPPWLQPQANWGALAAQRSRAKADLAMQQQRINQQAVQFNAQMEMRRMAMEAEERAQERQLKQQAEIAKHKLAVESAYHDIQSQLEAGRLEATNRAVDLDYAKQADLMQRRSAFEAGFQERRAKGESIADAARNNMLERGMTSGIPGAAGAVARLSQGDSPVNLEKVNVGGTDVIRGGGRWQIAPKKAAGPTRIERGPFGTIIVKTEGERDRVMKATAFKFSKQSKLDALNKNISENEGVKNKRGKAELAKWITDRDALLQELEMERRAFEPQAAPIMPPDEEDDEGTFDYDFDPSLNSMLTNSPGE